MVVSPDSPVAQCEGCVSSKRKVAVLAPVKGSV